MHYHDWRKLENVTKIKGFADINDLKLIEQSLKYNLEKELITKIKSNYYPHNLFLRLFDQ
jgi:hypothetical protein